MHEHIYTTVINQQGYDLLICFVVYKLHSLVTPSSKDKNRYAIDR